MPSTEPAEAFAAFACRLADAARAQTLPGWETAGASRDKGGDGYDPVTAADLAAEQAMRDLIMEVHPDHGIAGEELPDRASAGGYGWSLDPIDGTRSYVCGLPTWVTLIALLLHGEPILGVIDAPRLGERYLGTAAGSRLITADGESPLRVSECRDLASARFSTTEPGLFVGADAEAFERIRAAVRIVRYGHDGYAYARLAAGSLDLVVECGLKPHDLLALVPVVRGAGGIVGNWRGGTDLSEGRLVAAATPALFDQALAALAG